MTNTPPTAADTKPDESTAGKSVTLDGSSWPNASIAPAARTAVAVQTGIAGLMPRTLEEFWRLAQYVAASEIVPKDFRGKPHNTLIAIELALELGVPWMQGLQGMAVINGRPAPYGDLQLAIVMNSPLYKDHDEFFMVKGARKESLLAADWQHEDTCAVCVCERNGKPLPVTRRFSVAQAKTAGLLKKIGPWIEYPDRQLAMRARGFALRDCFPDVLKGLSHSAEELRDYPPDPAAVVEAPGVREIRRVSERHDFIDRSADIRHDDPDPAA